MGFKVLFLREMDQSGKDVLLRENIEIIISGGHSEQEFIKDLEKHQPDGIFCRTDLVTAAMMDASKNLKVIAKQGVGLDNIDLGAATKRGIRVTYDPLGNSNSVAEHGIMLMLMCARRFRYVDKQFRDGDFNVRYELVNTFELKGQTLGLIGCGRIGQMVAEKAHFGFGMNVIGFDPYVKKEHLKVPLELVENRDEVWKHADFISLHLPSLPETRASVGKKDFELMKKTGIFINVARGDVVVETELIDALRKGTILGAGLDVFEKEPIEYDNELLTLENAILTPHTAATTVQSVQRCCVTACEGIVDVLNGKDPVFWANKEAK